MYVCMCVCLAFEMIVLGDKLLVTLVTPAFPKRAVTRSIQQTEKRMCIREVGGWGRDPKKGTGRDWGMGSSTI